MPSQKSIEISNFSQMLPEVVQGSQKNQHFLIANANPIYSKGLGVTTQEEQISPLYASAKKDTIPGIILNGNVCHMLKDNALSNGEIFALTDNGYLYYIFSNNSYASFLRAGYATDSSLRVATWYNDIIGKVDVFVYSNLLNFWHIPNGYSNAWVDLGHFNNIDVNFGIRQVERFKAVTIVSDANGSVTYSRYLRILDASLVATTDANSLDLGGGVSCKGLKNLNDKYLAIAVGDASYYTNYGDNYLYLWDGNQVVAPNYFVKINGLYQGMEVIQGVLYVLVGEKYRQSTLYYLSGTILKPLFTINYGYSSTTPEYNLFNYYGSLGINLNTGLLIYDKEDGVRFMLNTDQVTMYAPGQSGKDIYSGINGNLYKETGVTFNNLNYISQYFEVSGKLDNVEIFYDQPPTSSNKISAFIDVIDENHPAGSLANSTTQLTDITSTTALTSKRTKLDGKGVLFSKIRVRLTTTGNWNCIIRKIKLNFSPITGQ